MRKVAPETILAESPHSFLASLGKMIRISFSVGSLLVSYDRSIERSSLPPLDRLLIVPDLLARTRHLPQQGNR
jgi:hypothetical protein